MFGSTELYFISIFAIEILDCVLLQNNALMRFLKAMFSRIIPFYSESGITVSAGVAASAGTTSISTIGSIIEMEINVK